MEYNNPIQYKDYSMLYRASRRVSRFELEDLRCVDGQHPIKVELTNDTLNRLLFVG